MKIEMVLPWPMSHPTPSPVEFEFGFHPADKQTNNPSCKHNLLGEGKNITVC